jgi:hypothetical protein
MSTQYQDVICSLTMPDLSSYRQIIPATLPSLPLNQKRELETER